MEAWQVPPAYIEEAAHLILYSASGVSSLPSSNSDVNDGMAVPAAYNSGCERVSSSEFEDELNSPRPLRPCLFSPTPVLAPVGTDEGERRRERHSPFSTIIDLPSDLLRTDRGSL